MKKHEQNTLEIYNSLSKKKEVFNPIKKGNIGLYVCGPTVYSDVHLGNCRTFISFDMIYFPLLWINVCTSANAYKQAICDCLGMQ